MKKILTILLCFALLLVLACPVTAEVDEYLLFVSFTDSFGNVIDAPLTIKFNETVNVSNIPLQVNGYTPYDVSVPDLLYADRVSITDDGYLSVSDVKSNLVVNVIYNVNDGYYPVGDIAVSVSYVGDDGIERAVCESSTVYADANGMMYVLPAVYNEYYPNGLVEVVASQTITESTPMLLSELVPQTTEADVTTVGDASSPTADSSADVSDTSETVTDASTDASDEASGTGADTTPLPEDTSVSEDASAPEDTFVPEDTSTSTETVVTTYSAVTPAKTSDIINASYSYTVYYLDMSSRDEFGNYAAIDPDGLSGITDTPVVNAVSEYMTVTGVYNLYPELGESALLSNISNFDINATNEVYFYYQIDTLGSLIVTRNSGEDNYKVYTLELVGGDFFARFALYGNDVILFENIPEGTYLITDVDASYTYGDGASNVISVTRNEQAVYEVVDVSYLNETESGWFTAQYSTTVTVIPQVTE